MITLTENQINILGRPNFACARIAQLLIKAGLYEGKTKAEHEQAIFIHWASNLLDKHGDDWGSEAAKILQELIKDISKLEASPDVQQQTGDKP